MANSDKKYHFLKLTSHQTVSNKQYLSAFPYPKYDTLSPSQITIVLCYGRQHLLMKTYSSPPYKPVAPTNNTTTAALSKKTMHIIAIFLILFTPWSLNSLVNTLFYDFRLTNMLQIIPKLINPHLPALGICDGLDSDIYSDSNFWYWIVSYSFFFQSLLKFLQLQSIELAWLLLDSIRCGCPCRTFV